MSSSPAVGATPRIAVSDISLPALDALHPEGCATVPASALVVALASTDASALADDHDVLDLVAACERLSGWAQAMGARALAEFVRRPVVGHARVAPPADRAPLGAVVRKFGDVEVAARLVCSRRNAAARIRTARLLAGRLPATLEALGSGRVDYPRAAVVAEETCDLPPHLVDLVEEQVLGAAQTQPPTRLRDRVRRHVLAVDPTAARQRSRRARERRAVSHWAEDDDMAVIQARLSADIAAQVWAAVQAAATGIAAQRAEGDRRTMEQLRADAFAAPFLRATVTGVLDGADPVQLARHRGAPATVHVTVPASALLGIADLPGELAGHGPISADLAREIAGDATWRRLLTDPVSGTVLDVGTSTYRPPASLARHVVARDGTCRAPGCRARGLGTDLDHTVPWPDGATADHNLSVTCRHDHRFKQQRGVRVEQPSAGTLHWTYPTGHRYTVTPEHLGRGDPLAGDPLGDNWHRLDELLADDAHGPSG